MTPGARGWIVLALVGFAGLWGFVIGQGVERAKWDRWTYAHVAFETKGDRR